MRKQDLIRLCIQNLLRKKSRTLLTVLGVVIGGCSIVIMVSLGIGMKEAQDKLLAQLGDLTIITVTPPQGGRGKTKLDDAAVRRIREVAGAEPALPRRSLKVASVRLYAGTGKRYVADWTSVLGLDASAMETMGLRLAEGERMAKSGDVVVGEFTAYSFRDTLRPEGSDTVDRWGGGWDENGNLINVPDPYFNIMREPLTMEIALENGSTFTVPLHVTGVAKEDYSKGTETSEGILMSLSDLEKIAEKARPGKKKAQNYTSVLVKVTDISRVADAEKKIKAMGFGTESMESIRKPMEEQARQKQMMLGGLGAISLIVAAIGITNTMIMSISARTK